MVIKNICAVLNNFLKCSVYENVIFCWVMHEQSIIDTIISGLDTAKLAESYPYLFQKDATNTQTLSSASTPGGTGKKITKAEIVAIKDPQERRRLIAENQDLFE